MNLTKIFLRRRNASGPLGGVVWPRAAAFSVFASRSDVHPGDGAAPRRFVARADSSAEAILRQAADPAWLPVLSESVVTWSITSHLVLAVVEHDCRQNSRALDLYVMADLDERLRAADWSDDELKLRFDYRPDSDAASLYESVSNAGTPP